MLLVALLANIGMAVNGFVANTGIIIRIGRMRVLKCGETFVKDLEIEPRADDVGIKVDADDVIVEETSACGHDEEIVSSECENSTVRGSVAGRVYVVSYATVT